MEATDLKEEERAKISQAYEFEKLKEIEEIIKHTSNLLSLLTNYTALILGPQLKKSAFKNYRLCRSINAGDCWYL